MQNDDPKPQPQPSGNQPPPRPPKQTAVGANPDDDDDSRPKEPNKDAVRFNLPPKPSAAPTIKLPTLPPGKSALDNVGLTKKVATLAPAATREARRADRNVELGMVLAAVLVLNGMLYILGRI
jgi:hypothetical protein